MFPKRATVYRCVSAECNKLPFYFLIKRKGPFKRSRRYGNDSQQTGPTSSQDCSHRRETGVTFSMKRRIRHHLLGGAEHRRPREPPWSRRSDSQIHTSNSSQSACGSTFNSGILAYLFDTPLRIRVSTRHDDEPPEPPTTSKPDVPRRGPRIPRAFEHSGNRLSTGGGGRSRGEVRAGLQHRRRPEVRGCYDGSRRSS